MRRRLGCRSREMEMRIDFDEQDSKYYPLHPYYIILTLTIIPWSLNLSWYELQTRRKTKTLPLF